VNLISGRTDCWQAWLSLARSFLHFLARSGNPGITGPLAGWLQQRDALPQPEHQPKEDLGGRDRRQGRGRGGQTSLVKRTLHLLISQSQTLGQFYQFGAKCKVSAILFHQQNCTQLHQCTQQEVTPNFYSICSMAGVARLFWSRAKFENYFSLQASLFEIRDVKVTILRSRIF